MDSQTGSGKNTSQRALGSSKILVHLARPGRRRKKYQICQFHVAGRLKPADKTKKIKSTMYSDKHSDHKYFTKEFTKEVEHLKLFFELFKLMSDRIENIVRISKLSKNTFANTLP